MASFQKLGSKRILVILLSSFTFIVLSAFSVNLVQPIYGANFGAAGDWGCNSNTEATVSNMDAKNPEVVFGLGDYSYASTGSCWFSRIDPEIDNQMKIAFGNHEDDSSEGFQGYMDRFGLTQTYYSYNHENVHVLVLDTDRNSFSSGSAQYNFVVNDLQAASQNPNIDWIIAYLHKPMYTSANTCDSSGCTNGGSTATSLRNTYHPLFDQYGVDLVLAGHVHNYQRTFTLKYDSGSPSSPTITSNNANTYTEGNGAVFAIVGTGGVGFFGLSAKASFVSSQQDDFFGQLDIATSNGGNTLEGKFYRNGNNAILDSFSITKSNSAPIANPQTVSVNKDTSKPITLTANDPNSDPLTYSIVTQPSHGTLSPNTPGGPARTYTPAAGYVGPDSFRFKANDGTVDSNTATVSINVINPGAYHYAPSLVLTGSNFQDVASSASLQLPQFSVAAWFKTSTNFGSDAFIVNKGGLGSESAGQNMNYGIWMASTEQIVGGFETSSGANHFAASPNAYNDGQWHYAIVMYDGITVRLYVDGVQVATKSTSGASPETSGTKPVRVGANSAVTPPGNFFTGEVDEVRVWSDDLTSTERANAFAGTSFNTAEQRLHLPFGASGGTYNYAPSLVLTGSNFQDVASSPSLQLPQFSVATWFKTSANFGSDAFIVNKGGISSDTSGQNMNYGIWMTSSEQMRGGFEDVGGADHFATSVNTYNDGQWHYAIVMYDGITVRLYVDGVQVATKSTSGASPETSGTKPVRVGANSGVEPPTNFFTGEVDEVRVWSDDLTSTERANAFAGTSFNTGEQRLHLDFSSAALSGGYNYDPSLSLSGPDS